MASELDLERMQRIASLEDRLANGADESAFDLFRVLAAPQSGSDRDRAVLGLARVAFRAGYERSALSAGREVLRRAPAHSEPHFLLCAFLLKRGDPEARALLETCLARFPQPSPGWIEIGDVLLEKGQQTAAIVCLGRGPPSAALSLRRGLLARDLGQPGEARAAFEDAVQRDPSSPRAWFLLGTSAQNARDPALAAAAYRTVLDLDPGRAEAAMNLGTVLQEAGDLGGAKAAYARAVRTRPDTFGRVAQALSTSPKGELWLDVGALRRSLAG